MSIKKIELDRPWLWLHLGWRDFCRMPVVGMAYGVVFMTAGVARAFVVWATEYLYLLLPMMPGSCCWGRWSALGLYDVSRQAGAEGPDPGTQFGLWLRSLTAWRHTRIRSRSWGWSWW